jgi:alkanesulfonate monooxygenase SsuD/methylene tetrahydromethanopterin reductase-like flavin-dependent oxidoreductase (luciferase family)
LAEPYVIVGLNVVAAGTDEEAVRLFTSQQIQSIGMVRGQRNQLGPPVDDIETCWTAMEKPAVEHKLTYSCVGSPGTVHEGVAVLVDETKADELIRVCPNRKERQAALS